MIRCIGRGRWRDKRLIAAGTNWLLEWADGLPARATEEGHWVSAERGTTCKAFDRQHKPEGLTAPSDESILCVFTYHRRGSAPITYVCASSMGMCRACQGCCSVNGCDIRRQQDEARAMRDGHDAREKQDGRDSKFEVLNAADFGPQPSPVSPFPSVSRVSRGDPAGQGTDGEADHYGGIRPGVENL